MLQTDLLINTLPYAASVGLIAFAVIKSWRREIIERQEGKCGDCGQYIGNKLEIHHKLPKGLGGGNNPSNLIGLCGEEFNDCHEKWDNEAYYNHRLPDGTPLRIPEGLERK
jgi:5-methylcytosine-specific restriction endonuclease McrA